MLAKFTPPPVGEPPAKPVVHDTLMTVNADWKKYGGYIEFKEEELSVKNNIFLDLYKQWQNSKSHSVDALNYALMYPNENNYGLSPNIQAIAEMDSGVRCPHCGEEL